MGDKMNRRENKIFSELIWNDKSTVAAFKDKYNVQERSIRLAIKSINDDLMEAGLPTIFENSEGELSIEDKDQIAVKEFEKFIQNYNLMKSLSHLMSIHFLYKIKNYDI